MQDVSRPPSLCWCDVPVLSGVEGVTGTRLVLAPCSPTVPPFRGPFCEEVLNRYEPSLPLMLRRSLGRDGGQRGGVRRGTWVGGHGVPLAKQCSSVAEECSSRAEELALRTMSQEEPVLRTGARFRMTEALASAALGSYRL